MTHLDVQNVSKKFRQTTVLDSISLAVEQGEFFSLLGPSGCGKTTLLRVLAGLLAPDAGRVTLGGVDMGRLPPHRRNVGVVFQNYALFPHLTVADNVAFGLRARRRPRAGIAPRVAELLALVQLGHLAQRPVAQLSGGQQQRIAIARALAPGPDLLLLDEPLSALDRKLRETMQVELRSLLRQLGMTAVFVTHDQEEALALSDRIAVMNAGCVEQLATPETIYARPSTPFVLDFVGQATILHGTVAEEKSATVMVDTAHGVLEVPGHMLRGSRAMVAIRPERIELKPAEPGWTGITLPIAERTFLGKSCLLHGALPAPDRATVELPPETAFTPGSTVPIAWRIPDGMLFPATTP